MPQPRHVRPQHLLLAVLVLLGALGLRTDVAAQQPSIQQANAPQTTVVSTTNTGSGSSGQTTTQVVQNHSSISQTQTTQGHSQQAATSQTTVATGGQSQVATQPSGSQPSGSQAPITASAPASTRATEAVVLATGCSNIVLSWPLGTTLADVAAAVTPTNALTSIFKLDAARGRYRGYTPTAPAFANDYIAVEAPLEAVFVCVNQSASLTRPTN
jgi:hypothetical protein